MLAPAGVQNACRSDKLLIAEILYMERLGGAFHDVVADVLTKNNLGFLATSSDNLEV